MLPLILHLEDSDFEASYLTSLSLSFLICEVGIMINLCQSKAFVQVKHSTRPSLLREPHKCGLMANTDCPQPGTVESVETAPGKGQQRGLEKKPELPHQGWGRGGRLTGGGCLCLLVEFGEATGSLGLELRLNCEIRSRPQFHGDEGS